MKIQLTLNSFIYFVSIIILHKQKYLISKLRKKYLQNLNNAFNMGQREYIVFFLNLICNILGTSI